MRLTNPVLFFLLLIFTLVNIVDGLTALFILPGESNPLYLLFGSIWPLVIFKYGLNGWLWFYYKRNIYPTNTTYYMIIIILVLGTLLFSLGALSNSMGIRNPELVEQAADIPTREKVIQYGVLSGLLGFIPMLFGVFAFKLYDMSRKKVTVDKEYFKQKAWWTVLRKWLQK